MSDHLYVRYVCHIYWYFFHACLNWLRVDHTCMRRFYCVLVTPYGEIHLGQHWFRQWLVAWRHQAIAWTNVDLSLVRSSDNHLRAISQEISHPSVIKISLKITCLKFHSDLPVANEINGSSFIHVIVCRLSAAKSLHGPMLTYSWWRHQMGTFSALLALCAGNSPVPVNSPHKGQWRGALMFAFICAWINDWVNNREAGDLRRHRGHYDVSVMCRLGPLE